jgi:UDP:flavonoid glycosyltransferase YjiC (YdhE family)
MKLPLIESPHEALEMLRRHDNRHYPIMRLQSLLRVHSGRVDAPEIGMRPDTFYCPYDTALFVLAARDAELNGEENGQVG